MMNSKKSKLFVCMLLCTLILTTLCLSACGDKNNGLMSVKGRRFMFAQVDVMQMCSSDRRLEIWNEMGLKDESEFNSWVIATEAKNANTIIEFKEDGTFSFFVFSDSIIIPESSRVEVGTYTQDKYFINCYTNSTSLAPTYVFRVWHEDCVALVIREFYDADGVIMQYMVVLDFEEITD